MMTTQAASFSSSKTAAICIATHLMTHTQTIQCVWGPFNFPKRKKRAAKSRRMTGTVWERADRGRCEIHAATIDSDPPDCPITVTSMIFKEPQSWAHDLARDSCHVHMTAARTVWPSPWISYSSTRWLYLRSDRPEQARVCF